MTHLCQRMIEDMGIRNLADNTQAAFQAAGDSQP